MHNDHLKEATFAAGCFWGVEETFRKLKGVKETEVGYSGGHTEHPTYEEVCSGTTGHAEAMRVVYDPDEIEYDDLLRVFWDNHDPTTKDRQGPDVGSQYRSVIFYHDDDQKQRAEASKTALKGSGKWKDTIVTEVVPAVPFYRAEDHHQKYLMKRGKNVC